MTGMVRALRVCAVVVGCGMTSLAIAGPIGPGDFLGSEVVQDYEGLLLQTYTFTFLTNPTPLVIGADTYTTDNGELRYASSFGPVVGRSGYGIANHSDMGFIDVVLGTPVTRAGAWIGTSAAWSGDADFFDTADILLGTMSVSGQGSVGAFVGWEATGGALIQRIRVTDTIANFSVIIMDDLTTETAGAIPEPTTLSLLALGGLGLLRKRRKR